MYNQIYNTIVKSTEGQKKKHFSMFTEAEQKHLIEKLDTIKNKITLSYHHAMKNNGIDITDIEKVLTSKKFEIIEYNETTKNNITDYRILIRSTTEVYTEFFDTKLQYPYKCYCNICFVISIKSGEIVTSYFNKAIDNHTTINFYRYENLNIIK
jgi:hypothetical protein